MMTEADMMRVQYPHEKKLGVNLPDNETGGDIIPFPRVATAYPGARRVSQRRLSLSPRVRRWLQGFLGALFLALCISPWIAAAILFNATN
jgi:hypothetical protein